MLIHEGRFTYQAKGLTLIEDLGAMWESRMQCPLPLAAIAIRRDLAGSHGPSVDHALRASVEYAFAHPDASAGYVREHAQELDPKVAAQHIQLYVNDYTVALDERSVHKMLEWHEAAGTRTGWRACANLHLTFTFLLLTFYFLLSTSNFLLPTFYKSSSSESAYALGTRLMTMVRPKPTRTVAASIPR